MKSLRKQNELPANKSDLFAKAVSLEDEGELAGAAAAYEKLVRVNPSNEAAWNRLMIIYRKLKEYKKELAIIDSGIKTFENRYSKQKSAGKKITQLSTILLKATGLADKKGKSTYEPEPIGRWKKRRLLVLKRLKN